MWEFLFGAGSGALGLALLYGLYRYYTRNRANDRITEEATREIYEEPRAYAAGGRAELKQQIKK